MRRRRRGLWLARVAAPAAFLVAATVAILLVRDGLHGDGAKGTAAPPATVVTTTRQTTTSSPAGPTPTPRAAPRFHTIRAGDTLATIAAEYETSVIELIRLNPGVEPTNLVVDRRIRVA